MYLDIFVAAVIVGLSLGDALTGHGIRVRNFIKRHLFFSLIFFSLFSCSYGQQNELPLDGEYYSINLDEKREPSIPLSFLFKSVRTIILETKKECMIGMINNFQVFDGFIYLLDGLVAKSLFVFDMDGKFVRKIGGAGRGPGEYSTPFDFTLGTENRFIYIRDESNRIHKYHLDGTYVNTLTIQLSGSNIKFIQYFNGKLYCNAFPWEPQKDDFLLLEADPNDGKIISRSIPLKYNKGWGSSLSINGSFFKSRLHSPPKFSLLFMNYIVSLGETITPYIELKSKNWTNESVIRNLSQDTRQIYESLRNTFGNRSILWNVSSFVENDGFLLLSFTVGYFDQNYVLFNKNTGEVKISDMISNDLIFRREKDGFWGNFGFSDTKGAYQSYNIEMLVRLLESMKNNQVENGLDKFHELEQLVKLKEEPNPVILFYEFIDAE